jgi:uncharacterized protein (TIGR00375 family)
MSFLADLHVHSCFSRATSRSCNLEGFYTWARLKGVRVVATGDMTHPGWETELREKLIPSGPGLFSLRPEIAARLAQDIPPACHGPVDFILSGEISSIYKKAGKCRKVHNLVFCPDMESLQRFNSRLDKRGNISSDGRPILGLDPRDLLEILLETTPEGFMIPAHIWTPWFSMLGAKSGFDSLEECFADLAPHIFAVETGLSSDPPMNWRISFLDRVSLVSNSDLHSPGKLGRNANIFHCEPDYFQIREALHLKNPRHFGGTIDIFPEEGKYHLDGHRKCGVCLEPEESRRRGSLCPVCKTPLVQGVLHRVFELADRPEGYIPGSALPHDYIIPLDEILGEIHACGTKTKKVQRIYLDLLSRFGPELDILRTIDLEPVSKAGFAHLHEAITRIRHRQVLRKAGFDGEYGTIRVFEKSEIENSQQPSCTIARAASSRPGVSLKKDKRSTAAGKSEKKQGLTSCEKGMVVTDLDGTLLRSDGTISGKNFEIFEKLGRKGITRVIATGRSLFSLKKVVPESFPADYVIFSTGTGIAAYPSNRLLTSSALHPSEVRMAAKILQDLDLDFSIQQPIPFNHYFKYWLSGRENPDFFRRLELYQGYCEPLAEIANTMGPAAQLLAILPPEEGASTLSRVREKLPDLTVIRATSPIDHKSIWTEIFPANVSKSKATYWLATQLGVPAGNILAVGNDFNDVDLLEMAGTGFVVENAPAELKLRYPTVASNNRCGVAEAIGKWTQASRLFLSGA